MKVIDKVFIEKTYREEDYDRRDFDRIKDVFREHGITNDHATILCSEMLYKYIENMMLDHVRSPLENKDGYQDVTEGRNVFMKNGITWYLYLHILGYTIININRQFKDRFSFFMGPHVNRFVFQLFNTFIIGIKEW